MARTQMAASSSGTERGISGCDTSAERSIVSALSARCGGLPQTISYSTAPSR